MRKRINSFLISIFSLPILFNLFIANAPKASAQQFSQTKLEEKVVDSSLEESYKTNSLIPLINSNLNPAENPEFYIGINKARLKLRIFQKQEERTFLLETPVTLGRKGWETPSGTFYLNRIINYPRWFPPKWAKTKIIPKPGKDNPYGLWMSELFTVDKKGEYAPWSSGDSMIRIHSTDEPSSIGKYVSHGCIRLHPSIAEELFPAMLYYLSHGKGKKTAKGIIYPLEKTIPIKIE